MKQELALESRSVETCTGEVLLVLIVTWAKNTLLTCLEGIEPLMGCIDLGLSNQMAPFLAGFKCGFYEFCSLRASHELSFPFPSCG